MKTKQEIEKELDSAYNELRRIEKEVPAGHCQWRIMRRYIDALEWVIE